MTRLLQKYIVRTMNGRLYALSERMLKNVLELRVTKFGEPWETRELRYSRRDDVALGSVANGRRSCSAAPLSAVPHVKLSAPLTLSAAAHAIRLPPGLFPRPV